MQQQHAHALGKADSIVRAAETAGRAMTASESNDLEIALTAARALSPQIKELESRNTLRSALNGGMLFTSSANHSDRTLRTDIGPKLTADYPDAFYTYIQSAGKNMQAALYEGSNGAGGFAVPITVDSQIVPLAPSEMAVRRLALVVPTNMDVKVPVKGSFGTAATKAENAAFTESDPTLGQFTLSAYLHGIQQTVSWELAQDVPAFQSFCVDDMMTATQLLEESFYIGGTGTGQAQGMIGNVGAGVTEEPDTAGNLISVDGTLDLVGKLNAVYHPNASWLMARATSILIRKAQRQANLFEPVFTRVGKQDYLHGYPVEYSSSMPVAARAAAPMLFGDFKAGYVIGDRGGSGINVKVLDQPLAQNGQIVLLAYRRTDGRVRRSEAIQQYNIAAS
jgi:HK97 family phage major capsid protein